MKHPLKHKLYRLSPARSLTLGTALLVLAACGAQWPDIPGSEQDPLEFLGSPQEKAEAAPTPPELSHLSKDARYDPFVNAGTVDMDEGRTLGSLGLNMDMYFDERLSDSDRIERLERAVAAMHRDLKAIVPALQQLNAENGGPPLQQPFNPSVYKAPLPAAAPSAAQSIPLEPTTNSAAVQVDEDMDETATHMQAQMPSLMGSPSMPGHASVSTPPPPSYMSAPPVAAAPPVPLSTQTAPPPAPAATVTTPTQSPPAQAKQPATPSQTTITDVRAGDHPDKVRLVFDLSGKTNFTADLDNTENLLVVEITGAAWGGAPKTKTFRNMPPLKSYSVDSTNGGQSHIVAIQLGKSSQILSKGKYPPLSGNGERIVIDLKK